MDVTLTKRSDEKEIVTKPVAKLRDYHDSPVYLYYKRMYDEEDESDESHVEDEVSRQRRTTRLPGDPPCLLNLYLSDSSDPSDDDELVKRTHGLLLPKNKTQPDPNIRFDSEPLINPDFMYWINTDGYFRENGEIAGHGLVVRDHCGNPITARSWFTKRPVSPLYHQLKGVLAAYQVAKDFQIKRLVVVCNHTWAHDVLDHFHTIADDKCYSVDPLARRRDYLDHSGLPSSEDSNLVCKIHANSACKFHPHDSNFVCKFCVQEYLSISSEDWQTVELFWQILEEILKLAAEFIGYQSLVNEVPRIKNTIADYMAKYGKTHEEDPVFQYTDAEGLEKVAVFKPTEFPGELKSLLIHLALMYRVKDCPQQLEYRPRNGVPFKLHPTLVYKKTVSLE